MAQALGCGRDPIRSTFASEKFPDLVDDDLLDGCFRDLPVGPAQARALRIRHALRAAERRQQRVLEIGRDVHLRNAAAGEAGVQPSVLVRFSQAFGFSGFAELQKVFQRSLADRAPTYAERVRRLGSLPGEGRSSSTVLQEFAWMNQAALQALAQNGVEEALERAIALLSDARTIHLLGQRRSHPTAVYLGYALTRAGKQTRVLTGAGGTLEDEMRTM